MREKLTKAQLEWLKRLVRAPDPSRIRPKPNWTMADRMEKAGIVEIVDPGGHFPWGVNWYLTITPAGRAALEAGEHHE